MEPWYLKHAHRETAKAGADYPHWEFVIAIDSDDFMSTEDDEGLTPKQIAAYKQDEWEFVNVTVYAIANGLVLGSASYGGIAYGSYPETDENDNLIGRSVITIKDIDNYVGNELAGEAQSRGLEAIESLMKIREESK